MLSYHNDPAIKAKYITRFEAHRAADEVVQKLGFSEGRGCFIGCTLDAYDPSRFPTELGWPEWLANLADTIFEHIPKKEAPQFGTDLLSSIPIGVDLEPLRAKFLLMLHQRKLENIKGETTPEIKAYIRSVKVVIKLLQDGIAIGSPEWDDACLAAASFAWSTSWVAEDSAQQHATQTAIWTVTHPASWYKVECGANYRSMPRAWYLKWSDARDIEHQAQRDDLLKLIREYHL